MIMQYFKADKYKTYRGLWLVTGFFVGSLVFIFLVRHRHLTPSFIVLIIGIILVLLAIVLDRELTYIAIDDHQNLIIKRIYKKIVIAAHNITALVYEKRLATFVLLIKYSQKDNNLKREYNIEFYSLEIINQLNSNLKNLNSNINLILDEAVENNFKKNEQLQIKTPKNQTGWMIFIFKWFTIGAIISLVILLL